ncbi:MAG: hypothetical protein P8Y27_14680, partial [Chromatiaceae bacterium]
RFARQVKAGALREQVIGVGVTAEVPAFHREVPALDAYGRRGGVTILKSGSASCAGWSNHPGAQRSSA